MLGRHEIATALVAQGKGILAADESIATMSKRLEAVGVRPSADMRRDYRQLLLTTPGLAQWVAGMIFSDETLGQELPDGSHGIDVCQQVTTGTLTAVFAELDAMGVDLAGIVPKPNMIVSGQRSHDQAGPAEVAHRTLQVLTATVPPAVPGVAFLSGGQSNERACANLTAINAQAAADDPAPWRPTFSFGRALVEDALGAWCGVPDHVAAAQAELAGNCQRASFAAAAVAAPVRT